MSHDLKALVAELKALAAKAEAQMAGGAQPTASATGKKDLSKLRKPKPSDPAPAGQKETEDAAGAGDRPDPVSDGGQDVDPSETDSETAPSAAAVGQETQEGAANTPNDDTEMDESIEQDTMPENDPAGNEEIAPDDQAGDEAPPLPTDQAANEEQDEANAADQAQAGDNEAGQNDNADADPAANAMGSGAVYLAGDGDSIGAHVGQAVLGDDVEALAQVSQRINAGQNLVMDWCEQNGGRVISAGGDEFVLEVPAVDPADLEQLRADYAAAVGATLTIGVGSSMSEAGKALIAGKLNGKDQVCNYDPSIDQTLQAASAGADAAGGEAKKQNDHYLKAMLSDDGDGNKEDGQVDPDEPQAKLDAVAPPEGEEAGEEPQQEAQLDKIQQAGAPAQQAAPGQAPGQQPPAAAAQAPGQPPADPNAQDPNAQEQDPGMADVMNDQVDKGNGEHIKGKLHEIMQAFRQDQQFVEGTQQSNPALYKECITLLKQMIKVAKMIQPAAQDANDVSGGAAPGNPALDDEDPAEAAKHANPGKKAPPQGHEEKSDDKAADKEGEGEAKPAKGAPKADDKKPFPPKKGEDEGDDKKPEDKKSDDKKPEEKKDEKKDFPPKK